MSLSCHIDDVGGGVVCGASGMCGHIYSMFSNIY